MFIEVIMIESVVFVRTVHLYCMLKTKPIKIYLFLKYLCKKIDKNKF
jgi:hypothetical protein